MTSIGGSEFKNSRNRKLMPRLIMFDCGSNKISDRLKSRIQLKYTYELIRGDISQRIGYSNFGRMIISIGYLNNEHKLENAI